MGGVQGRFPAVNVDQGDDLNIGWRPGAAPALSWYHGTVAFPSEAKQLL